MGRRDAPDVERVEAQPVRDGQAVKQGFANILIKEVLWPGKCPQQKTPGRGGSAECNIRLLHESPKQPHPAPTATEEHGKAIRPSSGERIAASFEVDQVAHDGAGGVAAKLGIHVGWAARAARVVVGQRLVQWHQWVV